MLEVKDGLMPFYNFEAKGYKLVEAVTDGHHRWKSDLKTNYRKNWHQKRILFRQIKRNVGQRNMDY